MPINFSKITGPSTADTLTIPKEIFSALPGNKYSYLRDVQAEVLEQWFGKKDQKDVRLKMNTGGGKTIVGLLICSATIRSSL